VRELETKLIEKAVSDFFSRDPKKIKGAIGQVGKIARDPNRSRRYLDELWEIFEEAKSIYWKSGLCAEDPLPKPVKVRLYLLKGLAAYRNRCLGEPQLFKTLTDRLVERVKNLKDLERAVAFFEAFVGFAAQGRRR